MYPAHTGFIQARLSKIRGLFKDKFILFKALFNKKYLHTIRRLGYFQNTFTHFYNINIFFTHETMTFIFTCSFGYRQYTKTICDVKTHLLKLQEYHTTISFPVNGINLFT